MEDPDWIQIAYVFDEEPSRETYKSLLDSAPRNSGPEYDADEFNVKYRDGDTGTQQIYSESEEVLEVIVGADYWTIEVWMDNYGIVIGFERTDRGLIPYSSQPSLNISTTIYAFEDPDGEESLAETKRRRREFVEFLAAMANIFEPKWGFGQRIGIAVGADETVEDLASRTTPPLYEYNVFRPETVEELGRERVLAAPAWYVEELDNGGAFLAVREPPRQCSPAAEPCLEVADHLGIPLGKTDRYH